AAPCNDDGRRMPDARTSMLRGRLSNLDERHTQAGIYPPYLMQDLLARGLAHQGFLELGVMEGERESREQLQMRSRGWADQGEQDVHRLTVQGSESDRPLQEAKGDGGASDMQDNRIPDMRKGDTVADGRGRRSLPGQEETQKQFPVCPIRKRQHLDKGTEC